MSELSRRTLFGCCLAVIGMVGCDRAPTDTGFTGTWTRGAEGRARAEISIWKEGGEYRFRVNRFGPDGSHDLRCGREGFCIEYSGNLAYYEYEYRVVRHDGEEGLNVECDGRPLTDSTTPVQWVERFVVTSDGLELEAWRLETNHRPVPTPRVRARYTKLSDDPFR